MFNVTIIASEQPCTEELAQRLKDDGMNCTIISDRERALVHLRDTLSQLVLVDLSAYDGHLPSEILAASRMDQPAIMAIVAIDKMDDVVTNAELADFIVRPYNVKEAEVRVRRVLQRKSGEEGGDIINFGSLYIDKASCEVRLDNQLVEMTFKEYELLLFLIKNRGRVFSRQILLDRVWGHDYYGGDRTVDVHVRRLRSKIEETGYSFIETVRNVGYKFARDPQSTNCYKLVNSDLIPTKPTFNIPVICT